ncbi:MAG: hypothetical protein K2G69_08325 [Muribaculaceae bacterium]|nr:hypothetical protein [Muribaculaceae bacterium]
MLIDASFFTRSPRHILNSAMGTLPNPNAMEVRRAIEDYIASHQEEFLCSMLGNHAGSRLNAYLVCKDEDEKATTCESFEAVAEELRGSFADYVFFHILSIANEQAKITGLVRLKTPDAYVSPLNRQIDSWNRMVERNRRIVARWQTDGFPMSGIEVSNAMLVKINPLGI